MHNSPRYSKRAVCTPLFGVSIVAVALLIIMGCLVQAIREALATEVSVEIGKPISLLSNQALGPVLHSLIQMWVPRTGLAKLIQHPNPPTLPPSPASPPALFLWHTHKTHMVAVSPSFAAALPSVSPLLSCFLSRTTLFLRLPQACALNKGTKNGFVSNFVAIRNPDREVLYGTKVVLPGVLHYLYFCEVWSNNDFLTFQLSPTVVKWHGADLEPALLYII